MYDTNQIWTALAETGKFKMPINFSEINDFREQLYAEARDEEVSLCISTSWIPEWGATSPIVYVSLRKQV